jgi:hypothetical protein
MKDCTELLTQVIEQLPTEERTLLESSPSMRKAWLMEQSDTHSVAMADLLSAWERLEARQDKAVETLVNLSAAPLNEYERIRQEQEWYESEVLKPLAIAHLRRRRMESEALTYEEVKDWEPAAEYLEETKRWVDAPTQFHPNRKHPLRGVGSRQEAERQGILVTGVFRVIKSSKWEGITKTQILLKMGKDTGRWRKSCDDVLRWMMANKRVVRDNRSLRGAKYYLPKYAEHLKESDFHRTVYEALRNGPQTRTAIVKETCYVNPKGHAKVIAALKLLEREGLVRPIGNKWEMY